MRPSQGPCVQDLLQGDFHLNGTSASEPFLCAAALTSCLEVGVKVLQEARCNRHLDPAGRCFPPICDPAEPPCLWSRIRGNAASKLISPPVLQLVDAAPVALSLPLKRPAGSLGLLQRGISRVHPLLGNAQLLMQRLWLWLAGQLIYSLSQLLEVCLSIGSL